MPEGLEAITQIRITLYGKSGGLKRKELRLTSGDLADMQSEQKGRLIVENG